LFAILVSKDVSIFLRAVNFTLVNNESVLGQIGSGDDCLVSAQQEENLGGICSNFGDSGGVAQVEGCYLRGNSLQDVEDLPTSGRLIQIQNQWNNPSNSILSYPRLRGVRNLLSQRENGSAIFSLELLGAENDHRVLGGGQFLAKLVLSTSQLLQNVGRVAQVLQKQVVDE
jgi:hypothetical protein